MSEAEERANELIEAALAYINQGWKVLPLYEVGPDGKCACGDAKCGSIGKHPRTLRGLEDASSEELQIREWWHRWPQANIGVRAGAESGLLVLDVDGAIGNTSLGELCAEHGKLPDGPCVYTGGGGFHFYFQFPGPQKNRRGFRENLDIRCDNGYVVAPPSNHQSGSPYEWDFALDLDHELPAAPPWLLEIIAAEPTEKGEAFKATDWDGLVPESVSEIVMSPGPARDRFNRKTKGLAGDRSPSAVDLGLANLLALGGVGADDIWKGVKYSRTRIDPKAKSKRDSYYQDTAAKAVAWAEARDADQITKGLERRTDLAIPGWQGGLMSSHPNHPKGDAAGGEPEPPAESATEDSGHGDVSEGSESPLSSSQPETVADDGFPARIVRWAAVRPNLRTRDVIDSLIEENTFTVVYGAPGSTKSFLALDWLSSISSGNDWFDEHKVQQGATLYIACEGGGGIAKRIDALRRTKLANQDVALYLLPRGVSLLEPEEVLQLIEDIRAIEKIDGVKFNQVVIDTLSRAMPGGNENSPQDMTAIVGACQRVQQEVLCGVLLVHHSGKDSSRGSRGHSSLFGGVDQEFHVEEAGEPGSRLFKVTSTKQRETESYQTWHYKLVVVELGENEVGRMISSCIIEPASKPEKEATKAPTKPVKLSDAGRILVNRMEDLIQRREGITTIPEGLQLDVAGAFDPGLMGFECAKLIKMAKSGDTFDFVSNSVVTGGDIERGSKEYRQFYRTVDRLEALQVLCRSGGYVWFRRGGPPF